MIILHQIIAVCTKCTVIIDKTSDVEKTLNSVPIMKSTKVCKMCLNLTLLKTSLILSAGAIYTQKGLIF